MKKLPFAKKKKVTVSQLKKKAWTLFSQWVRFSVATDFKSQCITCGVVKPSKELQAGHFIPGRHNSILFDERGCHPQCYHCNIGLKGNPRAYDAYMRAEYGVDVIEDLEMLDTVEHQFKTYELEAIIDQYKQKLKTIGL
jgi:hypothetical protein